MRDSDISLKIKIYHRQMQRQNTHVDATFNAPMEVRKRNYRLAMVANASEKNTYVCTQRY